MRSSNRPLVVAVLAVVLSVTAAAVVAAVAPPAAVATVAGNSQGCAARYWRAEEHLTSWQEGIQPGDFFVARFEMADEPPSISGMTMLGALQARGGRRLPGARRVLARAAAAAYLNAAYDADDASAMLFPWRRGDLGVNGEPALVPTVALELAHGSRAVVLELAHEIQAANHLGCPLG